MRNFINIVNGYLTEARAPQDPRNPPRRPARTQDVDPFAPFEPQDPFAPRPEQPLVPGAEQGAEQGSNLPTGDTPPSQEPTQGMPGSTRSAADTRRAAAGAQLPPGAADMLSQLHAHGAEDEIDDVEAARRAGLDPAHAHNAPTPGAEPVLPRNPENLPAVVGQALMAHGDTEYPDDWQPKWSQVKHLPGYLKNAIRALGRQVFGQFTDTSIEDLQVMATLINSEIDVRRMMAFIRKNGVKDDEATLDFNRSMQGYNADVQLWRMVGYEFLLVQDFAGYYIYGWPGGRGVHLPAPTQRGQLR